MMKKPFVFDSECRQTLLNFQQSLMNLPKLTTLDPDQPLHIWSDASRCGMGGVLAQMDADGEWKFLDFSSLRWSTSQADWSVRDIELYSVVTLLRKWHYVCWGRKLIIHTDHRSLEEKLESPKRRPTTCVHQWCQELFAYNIEFVYVKGGDNEFSDRLSREAGSKFPMEEEQVSLPAFG